MGNGMWIELIGYLGTAMIAVAMFMTSMVRLRIINSLGSITFSIYALLIHSYPTALLNFILVGINIYQLVRLRRGKRHYDMIQTDIDDGYISFLLSNCERDIQAWFPGFSLRKDAVDTVFLVCCDRNPAGLFLGKKKEQGEIEVLLDYATPVYRDTTVGQFLHEQLKQQGCKTLVFRGDAPKHIAYMNKMGYQNENGRYVLTL